MTVQRWLHNNILLKAKTHVCSTAYQPDCSPVENAREHCSARWLVKIDVKNFFESISERQVYHAFRTLARLLQSGSCLTINSARMLGFSCT